MRRANLLVQVVQLAGGELVGRVRLQKIFYLLDQLGLNSELDYEYHHYGPYADELASDLINALLRGELHEEVQYRVNDGARYSIFRLGEKAARKPITAIGKLGADRAKALIEKFKSVDATVLELAATIHWLKKTEKVADWKTEIKDRKGPKTERGRLAQAEALLREVGLSN